MIWDKGIRQKVRDIERWNTFASDPDVVALNLDESDDILVNPGRGWVIHYYDNTIEKYGNRLAPDDNLDDFPGFTTCYLRLAWNYLEPKEGEFNWQLIDTPIRRWTAAGKRIAFRISCCETDPKQPYATPKWLRDLGCKGQTFRPFRRDVTLTDGESWEPDYGDPMFLAKLEQFLAAFAQRYDSQPWMDFIDMGSYGCWGEWHTSFSSQRRWPDEVLKEHIDIHARNFKKTQLFILYGAGDELCDYARKTVKAGLRIDSVGVPWYVYNRGFYTHRYMFEKSYRRFPVVVEPDHYWACVRHNCWQKGSVLEHAVGALHPSWLTVHHYPREWLEENRDLVRRLSNRIGYWFLLKTVVHPKTVRAGEEFEVQMNWENRGCAPIYRKYPLVLSFVRCDSGVEVARLVHPSADCRRWKDGDSYVNHLRWLMPKEMSAGEYRLRVGLVDRPRDKQAAIAIGTVGREADGFYAVSRLTVEA
jgi:hypothetical protein